MAVSHCSVNDMAQFAISLFECEMKLKAWATVKMRSDLSKKCLISDDMAQFVLGFYESETRLKAWVTVMMRPDLGRK
ncbi:hypothetical protein J6590_005169 [Homalodisca vitripennis]|nr:hypothetical protein J6590_005169 [Homalodisca vitripennis]